MISPNRAAGACPSGYAADNTDIDGDTLTVATVTVPAHGTAAITGGTAVVYMPAAGYTGTDTFTYTINDGRGGTATATVTGTVSSATGTDTNVGKHDGDDEHEVRDACKHGGWEPFGFRNRRLCVASGGSVAADYHGAPWPLRADWTVRGHGRRCGHGHGDD